MQKKTLDYWLKVSCEDASAKNLTKNWSKSWSQGNVLPKNTT